MEIVSVDDGSLESLWKAVCDVCKDAEDRCVQSLVAHGTFAPGELGGEWISLHKRDAREWQSEQSDVFLFTHGSFMNRCRASSGVDFMLTELKRKKDSNRALVSLIDMEDLVGSDDAPIPSFLLMQCGFRNGDTTALHLSTYFRALEVCNFLPINLAEACLVAEAVMEEFNNIEKVHLTTHAFRAYYKKRFRCFRINDMDAAGNRAILRAVKDRDDEKLMLWLREKANDEPTFVSTSSLQQLLDCARELGGYNEKVCDALERTIETQKQLATARKIASQGRQIEELNQSIRTSLELAINELRELHRDRK